MHRETGMTGLFRTEYAASTAGVGVIAVPAVLVWWVQQFRIAGVFATVAKDIQTLFTQFENEGERAKSILNCKGCRIRSRP